MPRISITDLNRYGLVTDQYEQTIPPAAWTKVRNARFDERGVASFPGHRRIFNQTAATPLWIKQFPPTTLPRWVYADLTRAWVLENEVHTEITRSSGVYNGVASERWHGNLFNGLAVFNNTQDAPQLWGPISAATPLVDLPNWPATHRCKFLRPFGVFLVAGNIYDGSAQRPYRVRWSHPAVPGSAPSSWDVSDPAVDANERDLGVTSDELVDAQIHGDVLILYREYSTWGMRYIGFPDIFATFEITSEHGIMARDCATDIPAGHVVATRDDLVLHQGRKDTFQSLLDTQTRRWVYSQINPDRWYNCHVVRNVPEKEVWFCFPESGADYATLALTWSWRGLGIGIRALPETPFVAAGSVGPTQPDDTG